MGIVKKTRGRIFLGRMVLLAMAMSAVILIGIVLIITETTNTRVEAVWFVLGMVGIAVMVLGGMLAMAVVALKPTRDMMQVLEQVSAGEEGELPVSAMFNYEASGFYDAMIYVQELKRKDVDLRKKAAQARAAEKAIMEALNAMPVGVVILDKDMKVKYQNRQAPTTEGVDEQRKLALEFRADDTLENWLKGVEENTAETSKIWLGVEGKKLRHTAPDGRRYFDVMASHSGGKTTLVMIDQTELYDQDDRGLSFLALAAHELRGPITVIKGYLEVLGDELVGELNAEHQELFNRLVMSSSNLSNYVNNILNAAKYDQHILRLILKERKLGDIFAGIMGDLEMKAQTGGRKLEIEIPDDLPSIAADKSSLGQVFTNLIDNAIKYSYDDGTVKVKAALKGEVIEVDVIDRGLGIPAGLLPNLFNKFYRSHRSRASVVGTGVGLYISKAIVESHGGTMSVQSAEGKGTTFTVTLPIYANMASKLQGDESDNLSIVTEAPAKNVIKNHGRIIH